MKRFNHARILLYSHDTFGLGHLRRCQTIAHALVERFKGLTILIISGSQIAGAFGFKARVDFVKIPSVIKLLNGDYSSVSDHIDIKDTLAIREALILETATLFEPDIFIVDKEPMGLHNEVEATLEFLRSKGCSTVLGLRDVMDSPKLLAAEWNKKGTIQKINKLYDEVWIYGPEDFWDPLMGLEIPSSLAAKVRHVGFLPREILTASHSPEHVLPEDFVLVTAGGGGDGADIMSWILAAAENDTTLTTPMVLITGPFMKNDERSEITTRAAKLPNINVIEFDNEIEAIINRSRVVVGMCGYNTFCEVISFDKPSLFIPRMNPREEQLVRASRAAELGISQVLEPDKACIPEKMASALHKLLAAVPPSKAGWAMNMNGLDAIGDRVNEMMTRATNHQTAAAAQTQSHPGETVKTNFT